MEWENQDTYLPQVLDETTLPDEVQLKILLLSSELGIKEGNYQALLNRMATYALNSHKLKFVELAAIVSSGIANRVVLDYACMMQPKANAQSLVTPASWGKRPDGDVSIQP